MQAHDVLEVLNHLENAGVNTWLDGGWGIDALVGKQTRDHADVDLVISLEQVPLAEQALTILGFTVLESELPTRLDMSNARDHRIDFHIVTFDDDGDGIQKLQDGRLFHYPSYGFKGTGRIENHPVRCLTPEVQVLCHLGYEPDENDYHDMQLLEKHFKIKLPALFRDAE